MGGLAFSDRRVGMHLSDVAAESVSDRPFLVLAIVVLQTLDRVGHAFLANQLSRH